MFRTLPQIQNYHVIGAFYFDKLIEAGSWTLDFIIRNTRCYYIKMICKTSMW